VKPDDPLLKILACPLDKGPLRLVPGEREALYNPRLRRRYPVLDGIPQLLPSSGEQLSEEEHEKLLGLLGPEEPGPATGPDEGGAAGPGEREDPTP